MVAVVVVAVVVVAVFVIVVFVVAVLFRPGFKAMLSGQAGKVVLNWQ